MSTTSDSPESPSSLRRAASTIDDLTAALSNFSRVPSPEPPNVSTCCCGREDCESSRAWATCKAKLESRLVLSAEVGQALLERHEAYVRKHETGVSESESEKLDVHSFASKRTHEEVDLRVAGLVRENAVLEKRLSQALMNNEIVDLTHSSTLEELQAAKEKIAHLTAQNARYIGIDARLAVALQEKDDMQQERNSATQRARMAEARITSLKEKCSKLQAQVNRLREDLEMQRSHRQELSEEILNNARERLQQLQHMHSGRTPTDDNEITEILESLVADNEAFKRDNAELQNILAETREDMRALQEEVEEHRAGATDGSRSRHQPHDSIGSSVFGDQPISPTFQVGTAPALSPLQAGFAFQKPSTAGKRAISAERRIRRAFEPLTPETTRRPLTPPDSHHTTSRWSALSRTRYAPSHLSAEVEDDEAQSERPAAHKSLLLLTRSQSVQTDGTGVPSPFTTSPIPPFVSPSIGDHVSSHEGQSDTSTLADANPSVLGVLIERVSQLLNRLIQADALTLTTRLKRQHLVGADVPHLSRSTVNNILNENTALRTQFRAWLEDDKITTTCTRRDLRALFRLFKDVFSELGQLRVTLNDIILDPTLAGRVSELALNPAKAAASSGEGASGAGPSASAWIAPLSKFLGLPSGFGQEEAAVRTLSPPTRGRTPTRPPPRIVPKREPALSASTTHVNVEFSGAGVGRAVTTTSSVQAEGRLTASASNGSSVSAGEASRSVMNIFAGAPRVAEPVADPWVVVPKPQRASTMGTARRYDMAGGATIGRSALRNAALAAGNPNGDKRLSRIVDAMIDAPQASTSQDGEERDTVPDTLLERTLRPRGLSDSSIHTTYMAHEPETVSTSPQRTVEVRAERPDRQSVLQALSRKVQRLASQSFVVPSRPFVSTTVDTTAEPSAVPSRPQTPAESPVAEANPGAPITRRALSRAASPGGGLLPVLSSWAAALEPGEIEDDGRTRRTQNSMYVGDPREEAWGRGF